MKLNELRNFAELIRDCCWRPDTMFKLCVQAGFVASLGCLILALILWGMGWHQ